VTPGKTRTKHLAVWYQPELLTYCLRSEPRWSDSDHTAPKKFEKRCKATSDISQTSGPAWMRWHLSARRDSGLAQPSPTPDSCELRDCRPGSVKGSARRDAEGALDGSWPPRTMTERKPGHLHPQMRPGQRDTSWQSRVLSFRASRPACGVGQHESCGGSAVGPPRRRRERPSGAP
jgi:hypothetical protein